MMIRKREWWRLAFGLILLVFGGARLASAPLRVVGSDLLGPRVVAAMETFAEENGIEVEVDLQGSLRGRHDLEAGLADVALMSASPGDDDLPVEYSWEPLAYHVAVLWVPHELSLPQLSYEQLAEIFSNETTGARKRWRDFGAQGEGGTRWALPGKPDESSGLSIAVLRHKLGLSVNEESEPVLDDQTGQGGLLIRALPPPPDDEWEALAISLQQRGRAYRPTAINVHRGDYPLSWPLRLAFRRDRVESLYPVLRFLLSDGVARELLEAGMMPLPESVREERIFDLERL